MLKRMIPLIGLVAACATHDHDAPPPAWIVGKYHYAGNGSVAKKFPWEATSDLVLDHDGQYTLSVNVHINDEKGGDTDSDDSYGSYHVDDGKLILEPAHDNDDGNTEEFEIRGRRLAPKIPWPARLALKGFHIPNPEFVKAE